MPPETPEAITDLSAVQLPAADLNGAANEGAGRLLQDIMDAVAQGKPDNDHRPLQIVIESWHRSLILLQQNPKKYDDLMTRARRSHPRGELTEEELRGRLGA